MARVWIGQEDFDVSDQIAQLRAGDGGVGAVVTFLGTVRDRQGDQYGISSLELEHYPGMTERLLAQLALAAAQHHGASAVLVVHRVGLVAPAQAIVLVAVAADRRGPAQRCCGELLEALKHEAPFWKREWGASRGQWLQGNTPL